MANLSITEPNLRLSQAAICIAGILIAGCLIAWLPASFAPVSCAPASAAPAPSKTAVANPSKKAAGPSAIPASQSTVAPSPSTAAAQEKIIVFPNRTMGQLMRVAAPWPPNGRTPELVFYSLAQGPVKVSSKTGLYFKPNMTVCEHLDLLAEFPEGTLQILDLKNLEIDDNFLAAIGKLHSLRELNAKGAELTDDKLKVLNNLPNLQYLDLSRGLISGAGIRYLEASKDLRHLDLSWTSISPELGPALKKFPRLVTLFVARGKLKDQDLPAFAALSNLEHLKLSENADITDSGIKALLPLKHLRSIEVSDTKVTPAGLTQLKELPIREIVVDARHCDAAGKKLLKSTFPNAVLSIETRGNTSIPIEVFSPLH